MGPFWRRMLIGVAVTVQSAGTFPDPDAAGSTTFTSVRWAGRSSLSIEQLTFSPRATVTAPVAVTGVALPSHSQVLARYPAGPPLSESWYWPIFPGALVTAGPPVGPVTVIGPMALSVQSVGCAVPPPSLVTVLTRVRCGCCAVLVMVHVAA